TTRKLTRAELTIETSKALEANPIQGHQRPPRSSSQMQSEAIAAASVTKKPVTCTGVPGSLRIFQVGAIRSSPIAKTRTRATTNSPSIPAVASAGSGRAQIGGAATPSVRLSGPGELFMAGLHNTKPPTAGRLGFFPLSA